ncbi:hypothetical protein MBLNU13_g07905t1 [Cladosporium sp. NU13]
MSDTDANNMARTTPASPSFTGIPLELKHQIFGHLMHTGEVSGRMFLKKHKQEYSGDLLLQFISSSVTNALSMTCHQLRAEFDLFLATTANRPYVFIVNNLDPEQLLLFRTFLTTCRLSRQHSDSTIPLHLFQNVTLYLELNGDIHQSVAAYHKTLVRYNGHGIVPEAFDDYPKIVVQPEPSTWDSGRSAARTMSLIKAQAELAMFTEFNHVLATTPGQTYDLLVNNLDLEQLALFHRFVAAHCSFRRNTEVKMQPLPLLYKEVALHLKLDGSILESIDA